jgi:hypothetical protein
MLDNIAAPCFWLDVFPILQLLIIGSGETI